MLLTTLLVQFHRMLRVLACECWHLAQAPVPVVVQVQGWEQVVVQVQVQVVVQVWEQVVVPVPVQLLLQSQM